MDKPTFKLVGAPCGHHGQYTFYKALRICGDQDRIVAIGDFFFVRIWQDSELVSIGELQLLWTDRVSDHTLVSLRLYFLPENTPDGRSLQGEDEVLAINDKVVLRADDLLSWVSAGDGWRWGRRAVWRGACAPPADARTTSPLHCSRLDFSDVDREKNNIVDTESAGVVVFSYPRYCRYRALLSRLEGIQAAWLRDSLVAALGGYAAPTKNTRILYCKDTFEYPELEGHEFVCNHLAPRLKGRPRGRRRRRARSASHSSDRTSDSDSGESAPTEPQTPRRLSLRLNEPEKSGDEKEEWRSRKQNENMEDMAFLAQLKMFYKQRNETLKIGRSLRDLPLRALYAAVRARGGYEALCGAGAAAWRAALAGGRAHAHALAPHHARKHYERILLPFENYERRNGSKMRSRKLQNGTSKDLAVEPIDTIDMTGESPLREIEVLDKTPEKRLRTPSPNHRIDHEAKFDPTNLLDSKDDHEVTDKLAEELNQEFLDSLPKSEETRARADRLDGAAEVTAQNLTCPAVAGRGEADGVRSAAEDQVLGEQTDKFNIPDKVDVGIASVVHPQDLVTSSALSSLSTLSEKYATISNGHQTTITPLPLDQKTTSRPAGRSSLRSVRVKPTASRENRPQNSTTTPPVPPLRPDSSPPVSTITNFGINYLPQHTAPNETHSDDEIVEVPYRPKTPEIIDLDEYPESPQAVKKKKLDILKERGLEVTAIPGNWSNSVTTPVLTNPIASTILNQNPMLLNPTVQHQIMTQAQLFQMYNMIPPNYPNGIQPPKVIQAKSIFGTTGPQKTVYGNPKDPFMPPPHILQGTPIKPTRNIQVPTTPPQDILDLTCKGSEETSTPAVEIMRVPVPSPSKPAAQNLSKNYTLLDGKAVVGSNLEITLVSPKQNTPNKVRPPQKRSSNGKFMSNKTPTPPKDSKAYTSPVQSVVTSTSRSNERKSNIVVPSYQLSRDNSSPTSSTSSKDSAPPVPSAPLPNATNLMSVFKNPPNVNQLLDMQAKNVSNLTQFMDPVYMSALYSNLTGHLDQRQLAVYKEFMGQFRGYSGLLNMGTVTSTPTTKN